ncbi:MAG: hypothetical protein HY318_10365, partial [Armatimonadetes bacterium]|nr:hypothetical protein [Armatimonadota bacterium]
MVVIAALPQVLSAVPVEETPYGKSGLRLEIRPSPTGMLAHGKFGDIEATHAKAGISARWISVNTPLGSPEYESAFIPTDVKEAAENEALFKEWIRALHDNHLPVVSWYPLIITKSGAATHPEWRQKFLGTETEGHTKGIAV